jgi:hypothetical protein
MIAAIILVGGLVIFAASMVAARYASWFGIVVPVAIVYALGVAWEWDPEALVFVIAAGLIGGLGLVTGMVRRRRHRRRVREGLV